MVGARTEVGGDHATSAGGFSAGAGDGSIKAGYNGYGSFDNQRLSYGTGSGYYTRGTGQQLVEVFFNQGGMWQGRDINDDYYFYADYSGSGGNPRNRW